LRRRGLPHRPLGLWYLGRALGRGLGRALNWSMVQRERRVVVVQREPGQRFIGATAVRRPRSEWKLLRADLCVIRGRFNNRVAIGRCAPRVRACPRTWRRNRWSGSGHTRLGKLLRPRGKAGRHLGRGQWLPPAWRPASLL